MSELTLVLPSVLLVDAEEEQDVEEEEDEESSDDVADSLRGAGVGGIKAFLEVFFSVEITVGISAEGTSAETLQPSRDAQRLRRGGLTWLQGGGNVLCLVFKLCHCLNIELH